MEKSKSLRALKTSTDPYDKNPLDELFNVLNPTFKHGQHNKRYIDRDLPESFFNQQLRSRTLNPKREEAIKRAQIGHFQSLRRRRNPSSDKDTEKASPSKETYHQRRTSTKLREKLRPNSTYGTLRRKVPEVRHAHRTIEVESTAQQTRSGLSFKRVAIPMEKVPLPKEWEQIEIEIDGEIDVIYQHRTSNIKTRTDPRISIKTHLEELHVTLTAEMISRINNPTAFAQTKDNTPDLDLPSGCRWHQTEKGEVFFINDLARSTSWTHPRVEQQLVQEKLPPLNSQKRQSTQPKCRIVDRPKTHSKQVSIDSGVGSQSGSCHLYQRQRSSSRVKHRSISDNALLSPQFSIHEKDFTSMSPQSPYSELSSPISIQETSPMQIDEPKMTTPVRSTPNLHRGGGGGSGGGSPPAKMSVSAANIFLGAEISVNDNEQQQRHEDDNLLDEVQVDAIFDSLTSSDFEADTFIRSLLNDTGLEMD